MHYCSALDNSISNSVGVIDMLVSGRRRHVQLRDGNAVRLPACTHMVAIGSLFRWYWSIRPKLVHGSGLCDIFRTVMVYVGLLDMFDSIVCGHWSLAACAAT